MSWGRERRGWRRQPGGCGRICLALAVSLLGLGGCRSSAQGDRGADAGVQVDSGPGVSEAAAAAAEFRPEAGAEAAFPTRRVLSLHLGLGGLRGGWSGEGEGASALEPLLGFGLAVLGGREEDALLRSLGPLVSQGVLDVRWAERMRGILERESPAMRLDEEFRGLESTLAVSARALFDEGRPVAPDHAFVVLPEDYDPGRRYPILLFLHGWTMNFHLYVWGFWRQPAHNHWIVVLPTRDGWGTSLADWDRFYLELIEHVAMRYSGDAHRVCVAGHSAGAREALQFAVLHPAAVRCAASLAGTVPFRPEVDGQLRMLAGRSVLVHCASGDQVVPLAACRRVHERLAVRGVEHEYAVSPEMDHFSILEADSGLHALLMKWAEGVRAALPPGERPSGVVPEGIPFAEGEDLGWIDAAFVDLNSDGREEWIFRGSFGYCGSAGCSQMVFARRKGRWRAVLDEFGWSLEVLPATTKGYHDLELHERAWVDAATCRHVFKWNGRRYWRHSSSCVCPEGYERAAGGDCVPPDEQ